MTTTINSAFEQEKFPSSRVHTDAGAVASLVLMNYGGFVEKLVVTNPKVSAIVVQIHDAASLPADTAVPLLTFQVPASSAYVLDVPVFVENGAVVAVSSTLGELTISADTIHIYATVRK